MNVFDDVFCPECHSNQVVMLEDDDGKYLSCECGFDFTPSDVDLKRSMEFIQKKIK